MEKQNLSNLLNGKVFRIPDYQRGYAWEEKQWKDLVEDIDALVTDERVKSHYTGTVVTFTPDNSESTYNRKSVKIVEVVDGQQRLTTITLFLSVIIRALVKSGAADYEQDIPEFLYQGTTCKLTLNNSTDDLFYQLIKEGKPRQEVTTGHQRRLTGAVAYFTEYINSKLHDKESGIAFVKDLFAAITGKLAFTYYTIEEECEIGMTFELMNSRGKGLSVLELLKNYLMHWISRNGTDVERKELTDTVNQAWKDTYSNVGNSAGNGEQCLRIAWILYCHHLPKNWKGYDGFKGKNYLPLRDFSQKTRDETQKFLINFTNGLAAISRHYATIVSPNEKNTYSPAELEWLRRIHNTGNLANFLPVLVSSRINVEHNKALLGEHISLIKAIECFAYRVFLFEGKRSNAGKSSFYRWGKELFENTHTTSKIEALILSLVRYYSPEKDFVTKISTPFNWYSKKHFLKYTLFEYEKHLLETDSKGQKPLITWSDLAKDSTLEHILPQTPKKDSQWLRDWSREEIELHRHDIGNLVLTRDNSSYCNFEFKRKKGELGQGTCYGNSDIRQERRIAIFDEWTADSVVERKKELVTWILSNWHTSNVDVLEDVNEDEDEESLIAYQQS